MINPLLLLLLISLAYTVVALRSCRTFRSHLYTKKLSKLSYPLKSLLSSISNENIEGTIVSGGGGGGINGGDDGNNNASLSENNDNNDENQIPKPKQSGALLMLFMSLIDSYSSIMDKFPFRTKIISSMIIGMLGDFLIQKYESVSLKKAFDYRRFLIFGTVTGLYMAPALTAWYETLNAIPFLSKLGNIQKVLAMLFVDQSVGAIVITIGFFFAFEAVSILLYLAF